MKYTDSMELVGVKMGDWVVPVYFWTADDTIEAKIRVVEILFHIARSDDAETT